MVKKAIRKISNINGNLIFKLAALGIVAFVGYGILKRYGLIGPKDVTAPESGKCTPAWNTTVVKDCCKGTYFFDIPWQIGGMCVPEGATSADYAAHGLKAPSELKKAELPRCPSGNISVGKYDPRRLLPSYEYCPEGATARQPTQPRPTQPVQPVKGQFSGTKSYCLSKVQATSETQLMSYLHSATARQRGGVPTWRSYWLARVPECSELINIWANKA